MSVDPYATSWLFYGDFGTLKSTLAASFPKPMLVHCFDQPGKDRPYWRRGKQSALEDVGGVPTRLVHHPKTGKAIVRIEYYRNADATKPHAIADFRRQFQHIEATIERYRLKTIVIDSLTYMELAARHEAQHKLLKGARHAMKFYSHAKDVIEELVSIRACGLAELGVQVVVLAHIKSAPIQVDAEGDAIGSELFGPAAPGQLTRGLPGGFAEVYRTYVVQEVPMIQTVADNKYQATTQIPATNKLEFPTYKRIWQEAA
jgi:hypothetical protein